MGALSGAIKGIMGSATARSTSSTPATPSDRGSGIVQEDRPSLAKRVGEILISGRGPLRRRSVKPYMNLTGRR